MQLYSEYKTTPEQAQGDPFVHSFPQGLDRHTALRAWLIGSGNTITALAARVGISQSGLSWALKQERIPVRNYEILIAAGVPAALLPHPEDVRPGPKPKSSQL